MLPTVQKPHTGPSSAEFERLLRDHRAAFERLARRLTGDAEDAADLLQETVLDAFRSRAAFRPGTSFYAWIGRIMRNNHLDRVRRRRVVAIPLDAGPGGEEGEHLDLPDPGADPQQRLLQNQLEPAYDRAMSSLQPAYRAAVELCDLQGATYEEAAAAVSCPVGTIRSRLHRAHHALREFLGRLEPAEQAMPAPRPHSRRAFLQFGTAAAAGAALTGLASEGAASAPLRVLVSSEAGDPAAQALARSLERLPRVEVRADPGLSEAALAASDVVVWCGSSDMPQERLAAVLRRVRDDGAGLIVACAGGPPPLLQALLREGCPVVDGESKAESLDLEVAAPRHPVVRGVSGFRATGRSLVVGGQAPDVVVLDSPAGDGRRAWQGMVWTAGRGRVFYFAPGPEALAAGGEARRLLRNAVRWCGRADSAD